MLADQTLTEGTRRATCLLLAEVIYTANVWWSEVLANSWLQARERERRVK